MDTKKVNRTIKYLMESDHFQMQPIPNDNDYR